MNSLNLICYLENKGIELSPAECSIINIAFKTSDKEEVKKEILRIKNKYENTEDLHYQRRMA